ncbi:MAG TPA: NfeD family protein [Acidobacteriaceae bacterium]|nr:NfeD family protein [Acidobacteriaceae bacterium]
MKPYSHRQLVEIEGEIWSARLVAGAEAVPEGTEVRVEAVDGLVLRVGQ